jgi:DNA-binding transcriptional MerR regulator
MDFGMVSDPSSDSSSSSGATGANNSSAANLRRPPADGYFRIEQVAARTGLTKRTLRYYEEIGLLPPPTRTEGGYRLYSATDISHLDLIKRLRDLLGFSLAEIRDLADAEEERLALRAANAQEANPAARLARLQRATELTQRQMGIVEEKLAGLEEMRSELNARLERYAHIREDLQAELTAGEASGEASQAQPSESDPTSDARASAGAPPQS